MLRSMRPRTRFGWAALAFIAVTAASITYKARSKGGEIAELSDSVDATTASPEAVGSV